LTQGLSWLGTEYESIAATERIEKDFSPKLKAVPQEVIFELRTY
jgi:hypothetical protein